jgi:hypothetical protein
MMVFMGLSGDHGIFYRTIFLRVAEFGGEHPKKSESFQNLCQILVFKEILINFLVQLLGMENLTSSVEKPIAAKTG